MNALSDRLNRVSHGWVALAATALFALFLILVLPAQPQIEAQDGAEVTSPDLSFWYTPQELYRVAEAYGPEGRQAYVRARATFDVVWPIVYASFLGVVLSWVFRARGDDSGFWRRANMAPVAAAAFDYLENICTTIVMLRYPQTTPGVDVAAAVFTVTKWALLTGSFALVAVGLSSVVWIRSRARGKAR